MDDNIYQGTGSYTLKLSSTLPNVTVNNNLLTITLNDNDTPPVIQFSAASQTVLETAGASAATVTLSRASSHSIGVALDLINCSGRFT